MLVTAQLILFVFTLKFLVETLISVFLNLSSSKSLSDRLILDYSVSVLAFMIKWNVQNIININEYSELKIENIRIYFNFNWCGSLRKYLQWWVDQRLSIIYCKIVVYFLKFSNEHKESQFQTRMKLTFLLLWFSIQGFWKSRCEVFPFITLASRKSDACAPSRKMWVGESMHSR